MSNPDPEFGKIAVYSCYLGKPEPLNIHSMGAGKDYDRVLFTDDPNVIYPGARVRLLETYGLPPEYASRLPKIKPHLYFKGYDWVIYVDNRANLIVHPQDLISRIVKAQGGKVPAARYLFPHRKRDCPYKELRACRRLGMITARDVKRIRAAYRRIELAKESGLFVNTMMVQKMGCPETDALNEFWWDMFLHFCRRDQITLPHALKFHEKAAVVLSMDQKEFIEWPVYSREVRAEFRQTVGQ